VSSARRFVVRGRVQGVGYRYFALNAARDLGVAGFARNLPDGGVEVLAEADEAALQAFEARLREGPSFARVTDVEREPAAPRGDDSFHIR
jgi:acylphosphatase